MSDPVAVVHYNGQSDQTLGRTAALPTPPAGLAEFEQLVMAADAPAVVMIDRALMQSLLRYLRALEREAAGSFW